MFGVGVGHFCCGYLSEGVTGIDSGLMRVDQRDDCESEMGLKSESCRRIVLRCTMRSILLTLTVGMEVSMAGRPLLGPNRI